MFKCVNSLSQFEWYSDEIRNYAINELNCPHHVSQFLHGESSPEKTAMLKKGADNVNNLALKLYGEKLSTYRRRILEKAREQFPEEIEEISTFERGRLKMINFVLEAQNEPKFVEKMRAHSKMKPSKRQVIAYRVAVQTVEKLRPKAGTGEREDVECEVTTTSECEVTTTSETVERTPQTEKTRCPSPPRPSGKKFPADKEYELEGCVKVVATIKWVGYKKTTFVPLDRSMLKTEAVAIFFKKHGFTLNDDGSDGGSDGGGDGDGGDEGGGDRPRVHVEREVMLLNVM